MSSADARDELTGAFKRAIAAQRRLRSCESRGPLSYAQYALLFYLRGREALPSSELAHAADLRPASVTEMLDGLAAVGLVKRTRSLTDRRVVLVSLTERGRALVEARRAEFEPRLREALAGFSDQDLLTAAAVLDRLGSLFESLVEDRRPQAA